MQVPAPRATAGGDLGLGPMRLVWLAASLFWPRLFILGFWIFSDEVRRAFDGRALPLAGLLIAPWTTLAYLFTWGLSSDGVFGWEWSVIALGVLLDLWTWAEARRLRRSS